MWFLKKKGTTFKSLQLQKTENFEWQLGIPDKYCILFIRLCDLYSLINEYPVYKA